MSFLGESLHAERQARLAARGGVARVLKLDPFTLHIKELPGAEIGSISWAGGEVLSRYLIQNRGCVAGLRVIELGCGLGVAGLVARLVGAASVTLTDKGSLHDIASDNVAANADALNGSVFVRTLDWKDTEAAAANDYDVILGADVVYTDEGSVSLAKLLDTLMSPRGSARCALIAYKERGAGPAFWAALKSTGLTVGSTPLIRENEHTVIAITRTIAPPVAAPSRFPCALPR